MRKLLNIINLKDSGQGVVEYGLILALLVLIAIVGMKVFSETTCSLYQELVNKIT